MINVDTRYHCGDTVTASSRDIFIRETSTSCRSGISETGCCRLDNVQVLIKGVTDLTRLNLMRECLFRAIF